MTAPSSLASGHPVPDALRQAGLREGSVRALVVVASIMFSVAWTLLHGKSLHWDAVNYHFYLGYAALHDRFALDFFAAGTPSYINPYAYIPLHLLTVSGLPGVAVATVLAAVHALIFWVTYELALVTMGEVTLKERQGFAFLAILLALLSPLLLQGLGLTLVDIPLGALVVASWLALARAVRGGGLAGVATAGVLGGVAAGLKLSNAFYAVAALAMVAFVPGRGADKLRALFVFALGCGLAFVLVSIPWSWKLWTTFGNPLFPFLNDVFRSPDFTTATLHYERFRPASFVEYLTRPLDMLSPLSRQNSEGRAPDLRFLVLFAALAAGAAFAWRGRRAAPGAIPSASTVDSDARRALTALAVAFVLAWGLWLGSSGNSRYFIPMGCVGAVLLAALLQRAFRRWEDPTWVAIILIVLAQSVQLHMGADWKRDGGEWKGPLLELEYPERFRTEPALFLSTSFLSGSAFLPSWHPQSGMITISGFYAIGPDRAGWERAQRLIASNASRLRSLTLLPEGYDETTGLPGPASDLDVYVRRFGLAIDPADCTYVKAHTQFVDTAHGDPSQRWSTWISCRLRADPSGAERYAREVRNADVIFDRVEAACPKLFHPPRPVTEQHPNWTRLYNMGSEQQLWIANGRVLYRSPLHGGDPIDIGSAAAWGEAPQPIDCSVKYLPAFGLVGR